MKNPPNALHGPFERDSIPQIAFDAFGAQSFQAARRLLLLTNQNANRRALPRQVAGQRGFPRTPRHP